ncbi:hypothetical protein G7046_g3737 [Stylonectria norvegica]|nr:hypothetical protein G7046_g3737 [Stylonectria norvegica]
MRFSTIAVAAAAAVSVSAQRPSDTPICDYYTKALLKNNTAANQMTLLTLLVNTVVIGNYTMPNVGVKVPGILAPGKVNETEVNLLPYFNGDLASSNRGGKEGVSVNFLDGGGATPLMKNMPADNKTSKQYFLLTHLYQFFGSLLGCSMQGMTGFDAYNGTASMYSVHKFMNLNYAETTYFIQQVGMAAASFGVATDDITAVATALAGLFDVKCAPATTAIKAQGDQLQSICIAEDCPLAPNSTCAKYDAAVAPKNASDSTASASGTATGTMSETMSGTATGTMMMSASGTATGTAAAVASSTAGAAASGLSFAALAVGAAAFIL